MSRRRCNVRASKWVLTGLGLVCLAIWAYAATHWVGVRYPGWSIKFSTGAFHFNLYRRVLSKSSGPPNWSHQRMPLQIEIMPWTYGVFWGQQYRGYVAVHMPLWIPFAATALPACLLWRLDRRRYPKGHCRKCGYNLTGNVSGRCPECGEAI